MSKQIESVQKRFQRGFDGLNLSEASSQMVLVGGLLIAALWIGAGMWLEGLVFFIGIFVYFKFIRQLGVSTVPHVPCDLALSDESSEDESCGNSYRRQKLKQTVSIIQRRSRNNKPAMEKAEKTPISSVQTLRESRRTTRASTKDTEDPEANYLRLSKLRRGIINKVCPEKYDTLCGQLLWSIDGSQTDEAAQGNIFELVFGSVCRQHQYGDIFGDIVERLLTHFGSSESFFDILWDKCSAAFSSECFSDPGWMSDGDLAEEDRLDRMTRLKSRRIGFMKFCGVLVCRSLIPAKGPFEWIQRLFDTFRETKDEMKLELIWTLLQALGPNMIGSTAFSQEELATCQGYFDALEALKDSETIELRSRFLIKEVLEQRDAKWKSRDCSDSLKPRKLDKSRRCSSSTWSRSEVQLKHAAAMSSDATKLLPLSTGKEVQKKQLDVSEEEILNCGSFPLWKVGRGSSKDRYPSWIDQSCYEAMVYTLRDHCVQVVHDRDQKIWEMMRLLADHLTATSPDGGERPQKACVLCNAWSVKSVAAAMDGMNIRYVVLDASLDDHQRNAVINSYTDIDAIDSEFVHVLIVSSDISTRQDFDFSPPPTQTLFINFDLPPTMQLYMYRLLKRAVIRERPINKHKGNVTVNSGKWMEGVSIYTFFCPSSSPDSKLAFAMAILMELTGSVVSQDLLDVMSTVQQDDPRKSFSSCGKGVAKTYCS